MQFAPPTADEYPLIYDAWANSFRKSPWAGCIRNCDYDQVSRATIGEILARGARVITAVQDPEGGGQRRVLGYSVSEPGDQVLHWLFVKRDYRGMQIGTQLLRWTIADWTPYKPWRYSHRTRASVKFLNTATGHPAGRGNDCWIHDPVPARVKA